MTYEFTENELSVLRAAYDNAVIDGSWSSVYAVISASITTNGEAEEGVDPAVLAWVNGAMQVNAGVGPFSQFIRTYSAAQYVIRFGEVSATSLQTVSDDVAQGVAAHILGNGGLLPTLAEIGDKDAGTTIANYFNGDPAGWSGNPLFMFLGDDSFFRNAILHEASPTDPSAGDRYDFWAFVGSSIEALGQIKDLLDLGTQVFKTMMANGIGVAGTFTTVFKAMWDADALLAQTYGLHGPSLFNDYQLRFGTADQGDQIVVDNEHGWLVASGNGDDNVSGGTDQDIVDGGAGADILRGDAGADIVVGGAGNDILVGGKATNLSFNTPIDLTSDHTEWKDGVGDVLRGGDGNDKYLIQANESDTWDWMYFYDFNDEKAKELLSVIDTIDETTGDGVGEILIQMEYPYAEPEQRFEQVAVIGEYSFSYMDEFNRVAFYDGPAELALYYVTDDTGATVPYLFVIAGYPGSPVAAIKNFYQGDFGITLAGYDRVRPSQDPDETGASFTGSTDAEVFHGGTGSDSVDYSSSSAGVSVNLSTGTASGGSAEGDTLTSIERVIGSSHNDNIVGNNSDNLIQGEDGNDSIATGSGFDYISAGGGDDQVMLGSGQKFIDGGAGYDSALFVLERSAYEITVEGGHVTVTGNQFHATFSDVELLRFADEDVLVQQLLNPGITGTTGDDSIQGTSADDIIRGLAGDDYLDGGEGSDVYVYGAGDGDDVIHDGAIELSDTDVLRFTDLNLGDLRMTRTGEALIIQIISTGHTITVDTQYYDWAQGWALEELSFADGTSLTLDHSADTSWINGTNAAETIDGNWGNDYIIGGKGNDTLNGSAGGDMYIYAQGDGSDTINDDVGFTDNLDILRFTDLDASDFVAARHGDDVELTIVSTGEVITLKGPLYEDPGFWGVDRVEFSDGTFWDRETLLEIGLDAEDKITVVGTSGDDVLSGTSSHDVFDGGAGNDTLFGGNGSDTYLYSLGDGTDYIDDEANAANQVDILKFTDLNQSDISAARDGIHLKLTILGTGDTITLDEQYYADTDYWGFEKIEFSDGTSWNRDQIMSIGSEQSIGQVSLTPTGSGDDVFTGTEADDTFVFNGNFGHDTIEGFAAGAGSPDAIDVGVDVFADYASVMAAATQVGVDTLITHDANNSILLKNVALANLHQDDFRFTAAA